MLISTDPSLNSSLDLQNHNQSNKKKGGFEILDDSITSMKGELLQMRNFLWMKSLGSNRDLNTQRKRNTLVK